jgi:hypothetical protein
MKTFVANIFPKIQNYSEKLDDLSLLTNQHWVSIDEIMSSKTVYIFKSNNELIVATNGKVEREKWEYLGHKSLLIDKKEGSYLFNLSFYDDNILALKLDGREEYAIFVNQNKYGADLNSIHKVLEFLQHLYIDQSIKKTIENKTGVTITPPQTKPIGTFQTDNGEIRVELNFTGAIPAKYNKVFQGEEKAKNGKYKLGSMNYIKIHDGIIVDLTMF